MSVMYVVHRAVRRAGVGDDAPRQLLEPVVRVRRLEIALVADRPQPVVDVVGVGILRAEPGIELDVAVRGVGEGADDRARARDAGEPVRGGVRRRGPAERRRHLLRAVPHPVVAPL
jgi:hypothetical protein